jgi:hypothetical protein
MKDVVIPPPPVQALNKETTPSLAGDPVQVAGPSSTSQETVASASKRATPLDAAFLSRVYRSMLWFGIVLTLLIALAQKEVAAVTSFVGGMLLAALLLRAQELLVRSALRPKEQLGGMDARLIVVLALPLKFVLVAAALAALNAFGLIRPAILALGFFAAQLVIVAKVVGWMAFGRKAR